MFANISFAWMCKHAGVQLEHKLTYVTFDLLPSGRGCPSAISAETSDICLFTLVCLDRALAMNPPTP